MARTSLQTMMAVPARTPVLRVITPAYQPAYPPRPSTPTPRVGIFDALDGLGLTVALYSGGGLLLEQTKALATIVETSSERDGLLFLIRSAVDAVSAHADLARRRDDVTEAICRGSAAYTVRASVYQPGDEPMVLVNVTPNTPGPTPLTDEQLRERYALTGSEIRVARLIAEAKANKVIAATLGISEHTARHHTERVMQKMGIHSRAEVAKKLLPDG
jgi:DNA-binding CsgD family transcriptional regulator